MGRISVSKQQPPKLGNGVYVKDVSYKSEADFVVELTNWLAGFVSRARAMNLVVTASGFTEILRHIQHAPATMASAGSNKPATWRVHVEFFWGRTPDQKWWVQGIGLHIKDSVNRITTANQSAERERLEDEYERRNAMATPSGRKVWFEIEKYSDDFDGDLVKGRRIVQVLIDRVYEIAKEVAKMPVNPIGPNPDDPLSILVETLKLGVGTSVSMLDELGVVARSGFTIAATAADSADKVYGRFTDGDAVKGVVDLIDLGLSLAKVSGPFAPMVGIILGSFVEIGIANMAGPVTRVRSHMYVCYVAGIMKALVGTSAFKPERPGDEVMYKLGLKAVSKIPAPQRYNLQIALMEYGMRHPLGAWNLNSMYSGTLPPFPDAYLRYWSPAMVERSLLVQLCKAKYLYK